MNLDKCNNYRESTQEAKRRIFGRRFQDATLSSIRWDEKKIKKLHDWMVKPSGMLVLMGPPGTGKTYACAAIVDWIHQKCDRYRYHEEAKIFEKLRDCMSKGHEYSREIPGMLDDKIVLLNDVGSMGFDKIKYPWREEVWFMIIDTLYNNMTPTVVTSNLDQGQLLAITHPRLSSRIFDKSHTIIDLCGEQDFRQ